MDLFIRLVLAHFIGDYVLQTPKVYELKHSGPKGIAIHVAIVMACFVVMAAPFLDQPLVWAFIVFNYILHFLQDNIKLKYEQGAKYPVVGYVLDQLFHVGVVALLFFTPLRLLHTGHAEGNILLEIYNNDIIILSMIFLVLATYVGHWLIIAIKQSFFKNASTGAGFERRYGMIERAAILLMFIALPFGEYISPFILVLRYVISPLKDSPDRQLEMVLSGSVGIACGLGFKLILMP